MDHWEWRRFQLWAGNILDVAWEYPVRTLAFRITESELWNTEVETLELPREVVLHFSFSIEFHLFSTSIRYTAIYVSASLSLAAFVSCKETDSKEFSGSYNIFLLQISIPKIIEDLWKYVWAEFDENWDSFLCIIIFIMIPLGNRVIWLKSYFIDVDWPVDYSLAEPFEFLEESSWVFIHKHSFHFRVPSVRVNYSQL